MKQKIKRCIKISSSVGILLSFIWLLGVAGGSDTNAISSMEQLISYVIIGLVVMALCVLGFAWTDGEV